jgi:hypothetical protein
VLGLVARRDQPGHRGQPVVHGVPLELTGLEGPHAALVQRRADRGVLEALEHLQQVGLVVVDFLVDLPADAGAGERFGIALPFVRDRVDVGGDRAAAHALRVDPGADVHEPVRPGGAENRAEVVVADGEVLGQRELEGNVLARVVAHRVGAVHALRGDLRQDEVVHRAVVPHRVLVMPGMAARRNGLRAGGQRVQPERQQVAVRVCVLSGIGGRSGGLNGLVPHRLAAGQRDGRRVGEARDTGQGAEVVVERPVLLHEDYDVLDVAESSGAARRPGGERLADVRREKLGGEGSGCRRPCRGQEAASGEFGHRPAPSGSAGNCTARSSRTTAAGPRFS